MNHWLMKSEPSTFSIDDLARRPKRSSGWDGVRNYQARNFMRDDMAKGDLAFFYHSSCEVPGIAGIVTVTRPSHPDPTALDPNDPHYDPKSDPAKPRWFMVEVQLVRKLKRAITLDELRAHAEGKLADMHILRRGNRLSITPVSKAHWDFILSLE